MTTAKPFILAAALTAATSLAAVAEGAGAPTVGRAILGVHVDVTAVEATGFRASQLIGAAVYNDKNKEIGSVNDLIVSGDGRVNIAIVDVGGFLGLDAKHVAIPSQLFRQGQDQKIVLPGATEKDLKGMPSFQYTN